VFEDLAAGKAFSLTDFEDSYVFLNELTGLTIPADHGPEVDVMPTPQTRFVLPALKNWFKRNIDQLYWDRDMGTVKSRETREVGAT
jgi:hypothetical protein